MTSAPRVAFFTDSYEESNGVARLSHELEAYAERRDLPFLCVYGGSTTALTAPAPHARLALRRGALAFRLDHDLHFDPLLWRHYGRARDVIRDFQPDLIHITGPSDVGQLGALLGHRLSIPIVGSWHTNLHEYSALRSAKRFTWLPDSGQLAVRNWIEDRVLAATTLFYRIPRLLLAPNGELVTMLAARTRKPASLMRHGVDTRAFSPSKRSRSEAGGPVHIGFVGRLSAEKNVRLLATLDCALADAGLPCRFIVVGEGAEREWIETHVREVQCRGVLTGDALARAYADMDLFVFPSGSETFGLVVLEAMASGLPVVAMARGGPKFVVQSGTTGWLARTDEEFVAATLNIVRDRALRERLGRAARTLASDWSWDAVFDGLYEVYADLLARVEHRSLVGPVTTTPASASSVESRP